MFHVHTFFPHALLRQFVESYLIVSVDQMQDGYIEKTILPHITQSLVIELGEENTVYDCNLSEYCPPSFVVGPNDEICRVRLFSGMKKMIIHLHPGTLFKLFQIHTHQFNKGCINSEKYFGTLLTALSMEIRKIPLSEKIELVDSFLLQYLNTGKKQTRNVDEAFRLIKRTKGSISMGELEKVTFTTKRTLERHFLEQFGLHPKIFSRLVRFNAVIRFLDSDINVKWHRLAELFGYYDQSHFIHEFKTFTGKLPHDYMSYKSEYESKLNN